MLNNLGLLVFHMQTLPHNPESSVSRQPLKFHSHWIARSLSKYNYSLNLDDKFWLSVLCQKNKKIIRYMRTEVQLWNMNLHSLTRVHHPSSYQKLGSDRQQWGCVGVNRQGHEKPVFWCHQMKFVPKPARNLKLQLHMKIITIMNIIYYYHYKVNDALLCKPGRKHQSFLK